MADRRGSTFKGILVAARAVLALSLVLLGTLFSAGSFLESFWKINPWPGQHSTTPGAILFGLLGVLLLIGPMVAWWFLLPRVRWWGVPVTMLCATATFSVFYGRL